MSTNDLALEYELEVVQNITGGSSNRTNAQKSKIIEECNRRRPAGEQFSQRSLAAWANKELSVPTVPNQSNKKRNNFEGNDSLFHSDRTRKAKDMYPEIECALLD